MAQPIAELAVQVAPIVQRVHLVNAYSRQTRLPRFKRVEQANRFPVRQRHDDVATDLYVVKHRGGRRCIGHGPHCD